MTAVLLEPAGPGLWRICDSRCETGPQRFLAFVEEKSGMFEVMQFVDEFAWTLFPTMREAIDHVVATQSTTGVGDASRDIAWFD